MNLSTVSRTLVTALVGASVSVFALAANNNGITKGANNTLAPLEDDISSTTAFAHHAPTEKEKEYRELARKLREEDMAFEKQWHSAKAAERQKLRTDRFETLQPTLARMNALSRQIASERKSSLRPNGKPVDVVGTPKAPDETKGKTEQELEQMGIAVKALHQKKESSTESTATESTNPSATK